MDCDCQNTLDVIVVTRNYQKEEQRSFVSQTMQTFFYFHETDAFPYRPIHQIWMIIFSAFSFLFFYFADQITRIRLNNNEEQFNWLRQNTLLSFIHSFLSSIFIFIAVLRAPEMFDDPLSHINFFNYALIAFSIGYFIYDFVDCLQNSNSSIFAILVHHVVVVTFLSHILYRTRNIGYGLYALSLEINSVFLHARRLLRWYKPFSSSIVHQRQLKFFIDIGNYVTFILFRFVVVIRGLYRLYLEGYRLDPIVRIFTTACVSAIGILNLVLFYRLIINQIRRKSSKKREKFNEDHLLMTDNHVLLPS